MRRAAFAPASMSEGLASRSLSTSGRSAYAPRCGASGGQPSRETRAKAGEPKFLELEPARRLAARQVEGLKRVA
jgi:hypothetical protein